MEKGLQTTPGGGFIVRGSAPEEVFTPEEFTEEHQMIAKTTNDFIDNHVLPNIDKLENHDFSLLVTLLRKAGDLGLLGHSVPEQYGGSGLDKISAAVVYEKLGRSGGYSVAHANHTAIGTLPITYFGTPEQKAKYLADHAIGARLGAYCLTEPSAGSDALSGKTKAVLNEEGTHYILNGNKLFITNAGFADTFIVYAQVDGDKFTAFLVDRGTPGLIIGPEEQKMGINSSSTCPVIFEDCAVPVENVLGEIGRGHVIALNVLNLGRFNLGTAGLGGSKEALSRALKYGRERKQFGRELTAFPATQEKIARLAARIYALESLQYRTANLLEQALRDLYEEKPDTGKRFAKQSMEYAIECSICKVFGSETLDEVVDESLQIHGGYGFIKEYPIERMYRDSRINRIFEGTNEINRLLIPGMLFRRGALGTLALEQAVKQAFSEITREPQVPQQPVGRERGITDSIRRVLLYSAGLAYEKYGSSLEEEQEILMKLADLAIWLYALESAVLRTMKAVENNGAEREWLKIEFAKEFADQAASNAEAAARSLVSSLSKEEQVLANVESVYRQFATFARTGSIEGRRKIARALVAQVHNL
ncbi:acyl-CoA dehydrogenase family protein [Aneurinibacillus sp. Ricciae_BoGa-3]|uniref:acyl-CoA dehydrogenase family protein n=1 Tax=Aneurinibacillus sp. Ricciae_BoGa-3 TaxID=3022697 RepID=UPI002340BA50|nr:acyl-CoA dehydrogenase family protein [Aneurinibacillus sp. Ricciae_BoGa-3]WCK54404.1 acyl-CoA dehydrogenase family protein [Aneurinibacillus sp. Ricciae_BoGa-3]